MDSNNRIFITMVIFTVFFLGFTLFRTFFLKEETKVISKTVDVKSDVAELAAIKPIENRRFIVVDDNSSDTSPIIIDNKNLKFEFDKKTATITNLYIKDSFLGKNASGQLFNVLKGNNIDNSLQVRFGSWDKSITTTKLLGEDSKFNFIKKNDEYIFSLNFKDLSDDTLYLLEKKYTIKDDENLFRLDITLQNNKNKPIVFDDSNYAFSIGWGPGLGYDSEISKKRNTQYDNFGFYNGKKIINLPEKDKLFEKGKKLFATKEKFTQDKWIISNSHYFSSIIIPDDKEYSMFFDYTRMSKDVYFTGYSRKTDNSIIKNSFYIYVGPKKDSFLKKYEVAEKNSFNFSAPELKVLYKPVIPILEPAIGFVLNFIYGFVKNYGIAIILLTIFIKLLLSPLTHKSMLSQQKMGLLQPKIKELQEKHKDNPELLNRKTMELYKKEGINPLSGCLPLLLQMPILFAMYNLLNMMVELKGSKFLWISDLAMPDRVLPLNFVIPFVNFDSLNILPILMVVTQIMTSMLTPDMQSNKQAKMMMWMMPLIFFFFFYNVASGLVLYWTVMNILGIVQQMFSNYMGKKKKLGLTLKSKR